jgi:GAF domain-containing protein
MTIGGWEAPYMNLGATLTALCGRVEAMAPGSFAGVTVCDAGRNFIEQALFPSLPPTFAAAITGVSTEPSSFGSCVQAISMGEAITCADIANDQRFDPQWKKVCLAHGLRSLQSRPIFLNGKPFGTFVLSYRDPRPESDWDVALMTFAADAAGTALQSSIEGAAAAASSDGAVQRAAG